MTKPNEIFDDPDYVEFEDGFNCVATRNSISGIWTAVDFVTKFKATGDTALEARDELEQLIEEENSYADDEEEFERD